MFFSVSSILESGIRREEEANIQIIGLTFTFIINLGKIVSSFLDTPKNHNNFILIKVIRCMDDISSSRKIRRNQTYGSQCLLRKPVNESN